MSRLRPTAVSRSETPALEATQPCFPPALPLAATVPVPRQSHPQCYEDWLGCLWVWGLFRTAAHRQGREGDEPRRGPGGDVRGLQGEKPGPP